MTKPEAISLRVRGALRGAIPLPLRRGFAGLRRTFRDSRLQRRGLRFARRAGKASRCHFAHPVVAIVQEIKSSPFLTGKLANLILGASRLDGVVIAPGETLAFWRLIGRPSARAGFALGRSIRGGTAGGDVGGGLCQLSGIIYEAGLRAGLTPVERHPHSLDLYAEEDRFTPLGLDATVVWPWKDLRLVNRLTVPLRLTLAVRGLTLHAELHAPAQIEIATLGIDRSDQGQVRRVKVTRIANGRTETLSNDAYAAASFV